jgi:hypothetical protein
MKKAILSLLALPLLLACSSDESEVGGNAGRVPLQIEFDGITRAALDGTTLPNESKFGLFASTNYSYPYGYIVEDGDNQMVTYLDGKCNFDKNVYIPEGGSLYVWTYYPYNADLNKIIISDGWSLEADKQIDYLAGNSYAVATEASPNIKVSMRHLMSRIHVTVKKSADNTKNYYYKEAYLHNAYKYGRYSLTNNSFSLVGNTTTTLYGYTTNGNSSLQDGQVVEFDFLVLPTTSSYKMNVELPNSDPVVKTALPSRKYVAGEQYNITLTINHLGKLEASDWTIVPWTTNTQSALDVWKDSNIGEGDIENPTESIHEGHAYVDLGLPSGTLWATMNIDATSVTDIGGRFAWGETKSKTTFSWGNYKWCNGAYKTYTKYCFDSEFGFVDNKTTLDTEDDAANAQWGGSWRMPTHNEMTELANNCTVKRIELENASIYEVTGLNGKTIYFPADKTYTSLDTQLYSCELNAHDTQHGCNYVCALLFTTRESKLVTSNIYISRALYGAYVRPVFNKTLVVNPQLNN